MKIWYVMNKGFLQVYYESSEKEERALYMRTKKKEDINFHIACILRRRINRALNKKNKTGSSVKDLGCSIPELKFYLEGKFQDGMSWENYGTWQIDHIIPLAFFDLTDREQFLKACHYTNLQPLWAIDNFKKNSRYALST